MTTMNINSDRISNFDVDRLILTEMEWYAGRKRCTGKYIKVRLFSKGAVITDIFKRSFFYMVLKDYDYICNVKCIKEEAETREDFNEKWRSLNWRYAYSYLGIIIRVRACLELLNL
jgi:hypothetical protein